ncbi:hypothetical protein PAXINDRAFT_21641 [Paxillus involutus ATCC 200175]|uniref:Uncharacterized protein n=1 Tax=Paxillus involutus ATCC 200175 TaxID=664439 RepID=A0A0C9T0S5_PAXIN|nr:hypothetical protein PAXINDRAFT_21641 [Paxillus involutus ATCC 200175]
MLNLSIVAVPKCGASSLMFAAGPLSSTFALLTRQGKVDTRDRKPDVVDRSLAKSLSTTARLGYENHWQSVSVSETGSSPSSFPGDEQCLNSCIAFNSNACGHCLRAEVVSEGTMLKVACIIISEAQQGRDEIPRNGHLEQHMHRHPYPIALSSVSVTARA